MSESEHQIALFVWAHYHKTTLPELRWMIHIPNGGMRSKRTAGRLKAEGVKSGVSDILLPVARGGFHGLWVEMKNIKPRGVLSAEQKAWLDGMASEGYSTYVAYGWEQAADVIKQYLAPPAVP